MVQICFSLMPAQREQVLLIAYDNCITWAMLSLQLYRGAPVT